MPLERRDIRAVHGAAVAKDKTSFWRVGATEESANLMVLPYIPSVMHTLALAKADGAERVVTVGSHILLLHNGRRKGCYSASGTFEGEYPTALHTWLARQSGTVVPARHVDLRSLWVHWPDGLVAQRLITQPSRCIYVP